MSEKENYLMTWEREFQTTLKIIGAYPSDRMGYQPHEKSSNASKLMWTFYMEELLVGMTVKGAIDFGTPWPPAPATKDEIVATYTKSHKEMVEKVKAMPEADYNSTIQFPVAKGQMGDIRKADVMWFMLMDHVHHRGQLSVYIRLAGGKVPSIYGPSADEPWM